MGGSDDELSTRALEVLRELADAWAEIPPGDRLRDRALRLLRVHDLRAADALQLAAAVLLSADAPESLPFVCLDQRLRDAASREGFALVPAKIV
jgi:predicted nucleic acid-binding protein